MNRNWNPAPCALRHFPLVLAAAACIAIGARPAAAQEKVLYSFSGSISSGTDGSSPYAGLVMDAKGDLFGTTTGGGAYNSIYGGDGTVFELTPGAGGSYTEKVLYSFGANASDGVNPQAGLVLDAKGNLYGSTVSGGKNGAGTVYELVAGTTLPWTEKILYSFGVNSTDGSGPKAGVILDATGNVYGTTTAGGANSLGTAFELVAGTTLPWTEKILYSFGANSTDGTGPRANLIFDAKGNLYGTTAAGGKYSAGTVFELKPASTLPWTETILHPFDQNGTDGSLPYGGLIFDASGNLYGTTFGGGSNPSYGGLGSVYELVAEAGGTYMEKVIHSFGGSPDGNYPYGSLVFDAYGNLYGTTASGGSVNAPYDSYGMIFELTPAAGGSWTESEVYAFGSAVGDGTAPTCNLIADANGDLFGTTGSGGTADAGLGGTVFEIVSAATAIPVFSPPAGPYTTTQMVKITDATAGATIYYTVGGATPTTASNKYTGEIEVSESETLKAIAAAPDHPISGVATAGYQIGGITPPPVFGQSSGIFQGGTLITLSDSNSNAVVYCTINGDTPTTSSDQCNPYISVDVSETVKAFAVAPGYEPSTVVTASFIVAPITGPSQNILYSFSATATDGGVPIGGVVVDAKGNIYGTTKFGGPNSVLLAGKTVTGGTAFELSPKSGGGWTEKILYNFGASGDGANPIAGMVFDAKGNLYGTTFEGGQYGGGTVFELTPSTTGYWKETILHSFENFGTGSDGLNPEAGVIFDSKGNLYGTTYNGGVNGYGAVFELLPGTGGTWTEQTLHSFSYLGQKDGYFPAAGVVFDSKGNLYGTTTDGGSAADLQGGGTVFELTAATGADWPETILVNFGGGDNVIGYQPQGGVIINSSGTLYGANYAGGPGGFGLDGTLFELFQEADGTWEHGVVHQFVGNPDGSNPSSTIVFDAQGHPWGTTVYGGAAKAGTVYELLPETGEYVFHSFALNGTDGGLPYAALTTDAAGNLYGTTAFGGTHSTSTSGTTGGTVFEIVTTKTTANPKFTPAAGTYTAGQKVTIADATAGAVIYYTTDGADPTAAPIKYTGAITVSETETIKAIAIAPGDVESAIVSAKFTVSTPMTTATLTPASMTFPSTAEGASSAAQAATLKNTGTVALTMAAGAITITGTGAASFSKTTTCGTSLAAAATCSISVIFKPSAPGVVTATLSVADNATGSPQTVALTGTGAAQAVLTLTPATLSFPNTVVGATSAAQTIAVKNTGTVAATLKSIALAGTSPASFIQVNNCPASLAAGASCTVAVAFKPASAAALTAALSIADNAAGSPQTAALSGTGTAEPTVTLSKTTLAFASTAVGAATAYQAVTLTNAGTSTLAIASIAVTGTNPGSFVELNTCQPTLAAAASCTVYVAFKPAKTGALTGSITVTDNGAASPQAITLTGTGAS
jgi:uncharacterized repeat protein (TIGR03803 family)